MVNKIDGNNYYDYAKPKKADIPDTGEKFSLGYDKNELPFEQKDKKEEEVSGKERPQATVRDGVRLDISSGGRYAGTGGQKQAEEAKPRTSSGQTSLLEPIQTFLAAAIAAVKEFFHNIWNDPQPENASPDVSESIKIAEIGEEAGSVENADIAENAEAAENAETAEAAGIREKAAGTENAGTIDETFPAGTAGNVEALLDKEYLDREIRRHLRKGNIEQAINILTDNGRKKAARNSTLLTSYDKSGRVVEPNVSVRERTLYGDKKTRKL